MSATSALTRGESPGWRSLFPVTRVTRDFVTAQIPVLQGAYAVAVGLVYWAAQIDGVVGQDLMRWWLAESIASIALRSLLYLPVVRASPVEIAASPALRLAPLLAVALGAGHWIWTATIFVGSSLDLTTLVVFLAFVMLSISCIAVAPASPAACFVYLISLSFAMAYQLGHADWVGIGTFWVLLATLAVRSGLELAGDSYEAVVGRQSHGFDPTAHPKLRHETFEPGVDGLVAPAEPSRQILRAVPSSGMPQEHELVARQFIGREQLVARQLQGALAELHGDHACRHPEPGVACVVEAVSVWRSDDEGADPVAAPAGRGRNDDGGREAESPGEDDGRSLLRCDDVDIVVACRRGVRCAVLEPGVRGEVPASLVLERPVRITRQEGPARAEAVVVANIGRKVGVVGAESGRRFVQQTDEIGQVVGLLHPHDDIPDVVQVVRRRRDVTQRSTRG